MANRYKTQRTVLKDIEEDYFKKGKKYVFCFKKYRKELEGNFINSWHKIIMGIVFNGEDEYIATVNGFLVPVEWCKEVVEIKGGNK